jgi:hypothetical protein
MLSQRSRRGEEGQVLIMAIAFLALFGVITVAVLNFADAVALQIVHTEATAARDSSAEGGAAYAVADATRPADPLTCTPGAKGTLTMQGGDAVGYTISGCNPGLTSLLGGTGHCLLCILNQTPIPPATNTSPTTSVLSANKGVTTTGGDDYINGTISAGTKLTATARPGPASIYVLNGAASSGCTCNPLPVKTYSTPISDPFGTLDAPSPVAGKPSGCPPASWDAAKGCTENLSTGSSTIGPGLWASLAISGNASVHVTASSGVYVFTGGLTVSGQATFTATSGVTIYLACPNYGPIGRACPSSGSVGRTGGYISFSGKADASISAPGSAQYDSVGGIADVAILADPNLLDPGGVSNCIGGTGCIYSVSGNGASITGSIDTRSGGVAIGGNGGLTENKGLLITNSLFIGVSGDDGTGLDLTGPGTLTTGSCAVFEDNVNGTTTKNGVRTSSTTGFAVIQSTCGPGNASGMVDFNYLP